MSSTLTFTKLAVPPFTFFVIVLLLIRMQGQSLEQSQELEVIKFFLDTAYAENEQDCLNIGLVDSSLQNRDQILMQTEKAVTIQNGKLVVYREINNIRSNITSIANLIKDFLGEEGSMLICNFGPYTTADFNPFYISNIKFQKDFVNIHYILDGHGFEVSYTIQEGTVELTEIKISLGVTDDYKIQIVKNETRSGLVRERTYAVTLEQLMQMDVTEWINRSVQESFVIIREDAIRFSDFNQIMETLTEEQRSEVALEGIHNLLK